MFFSGNNIPEYLINIILLKLCILKYLPTFNSELTRVFKYIALVTMTKRTMQYYKVPS